MYRLTKSGDPEGEWQPVSVALSVFLFLSLPCLSALSSPIGIPC